MWAKVENHQFWGTSCTVYIDCPRKHWTAKRWKAEANAPDINQCDKQNPPILIIEPNEGPPYLHIPPDKPPIKPYSKTLSTKTFGIDILFDSDTVLTFPTNRFFSIDTILDALNEAYMKGYRKAGSDYMDGENPYIK